jgi:mRNA interferase MazF
MGRFVKGDIVVVPFPFSDLSASKRRPALVLAALDSADLILCQITSKNVKDGSAVTLRAEDVEGGSLKDVSNIRPNKLFTADESIVLYKLGHLRQAKWDVVLKTVFDIFQK